MTTSPSTLRKIIGTLIGLGVALTACSGGVPAATEPAQHVTDTGFVCPEPSPRLEVSSKEVNLFVWTEYIPQDILDCFEMVYGVTVNRDEFSSNEEMYAKLAAGAANYDLTQPSDYIIQVMIRTNLVQKLDKSKLPNLSNIDPAYLRVPGDDNGEYVVPYQAGTQAIVYDSATVSNPPKSWKDLWNPEFKDRMVFVKGKVEKTIPQTMPEQISLLRLDTDWYESSRHELAHLFPLLARKGVLILDDYRYWAGQKKATDEYFTETKTPMLLVDNIGGATVGVKIS